MYWRLNLLSLGFQNRDSERSRKAVACLTRSRRGGNFLASGEQAASDRFWQLFMVVGNWRLSWQAIIEKSIFTLPQALAPAACILALIEFT